MSNDLLALLPGLEPLRASVSRLRVGYERFDEFTGRLVGQLDALRLGLERDEQQRDFERQRLAEQQRELDDRESRLDEARRQQEEAAEAVRAENHRLTRLAAELEQSRVELIALRQSDEAARAEAEAILERARRLEIAAAARDADLETARQQAALAQEAAARVRQMEGEVATLRAELERERAMAALRAASSGAEGDGEVQKHLEQMAAERDAWQSERAALETELETVRNRAAELAENLSIQSRQIAEERAQWAGELRLLRRTLEKQTEVVAERIEAPRPAERPAERQRPAAPSGDSSADPVLDSVMAQFQSLQKEAILRRANAKRQEVA